MTISGRTWLAGKFLHNGAKFPVCRHLPRAHKHTAIISYDPPASQVFASTKDNKQLAAIIQAAMNQLGSTNIAIDWRFEIPWSYSII